MYVDIYIYVDICVCKTSLNSQTMGPTLNGPFRNLIGLGNQNIFAMALYGHLSICGSGRLERMYCILYIHIHMYICIYVYMYNYTYMCITT